MKTIAMAAAILAVTTASPAEAQKRAPVPQPAAQPGYQATDIDPVMARFNALQAQLNALQQSAGRQIVTLHFEPGQGPSTADNNYNTNQQSATFLCEQLLKERYGRLLSYRIHNADDRFYFTHVLCETKP